MIKTMNKKILSPKSWLTNLLAGLLLAGLFTTSAQAADTVSVSNYPLFLLSEAVTKGAPSAKKLLNPGEVGHHGSISPKDIKTVQDSTFVVWFGAPLENNLASTLDSAPNAISLFAFDAFKRYSMRDVAGEPLADTLDTHIWLDPENAKAITRALAVIHSHADPKNKTLYQANAQKFAQRMDRAVASQKRSGQPVSAYWAYHDAYQYLEPSLNLQLAGSLTADHHLAPKASQIRQLSERRPNKRMCLVTQSKPAKGLITKLQPVKTTIQLEDMSASDDFVTGWSQMAQQIAKCID